MANYGIMNQNKTRVINWLREGKSAYKISKLLGCSRTSVLKWIESNNLRYLNQNTPKADTNNLLKDKLEKVIRLHKNGLTYTDISKKVGHSHTSIAQLLRNNGYYEQNHTVYSLDENFFEKIDTQEKAYILGWFFSDGTVDSRGLSRIQIQKEDEEILYKIKDVLKYEGPLYDVPPPKKFPHRKPQTVLAISRKKISEDLISLGCVPKKSLILEYPEINPELENHFIRGVFDGDGSVSIKKNKYPITSITSSTAFNKILSDKLSKLGINTNTYHKKKKKDTSTIMTTSSSESIKFLNWIYRDSNINLERKFNIYTSITRPTSN